MASVVAFRSHAALASACRRTVRALPPVSVLFRGHDARGCGSEAGTASSTAASSGGGLSKTANSFISLGAFETMGTDVARAATGIAYLEEAAKLQESQFEAETDPLRRSSRAFGYAKTLLEVARQHHGQADPELAAKYYKKAIDLVEEGISLREQQDAADESALKNVTYARFLLSELYSGVGVAYNDLGGKADEALEAMQKALQLRKDTVGKDHPSMAECYNNLGALYHGRGALEKAADQYEKALEMLIIAAGGRQEGAHIAMTLYNIGVCRLRLGQMPEASAALNKALNLAEQSLGSGHPQVELIKNTIAQGGKAPPSADRPSPEAQAE
eukprot:TRINITY_DN25013_c0_g1_i1.p1 TRINITY_DN25013_c0_g1~~TRINITY_DN25013_c0_g1_i1.p1  ORF type:complete len:330 (-),score=79.14 TRINITY_DN25013_c0_g1_i1:10-999(-)